MAAALGELLLEPLERTPLFHVLQSLVEDRLQLGVVQGFGEEVQQRPA